MKIKFQRTGGFAGIPVNVELDSANLTQEVGERLLGLVNKVLPFKAEKAEAMADGHNYDLIVETDGKAEELHVDDSQLTDDLQELFDFILEQ